MNQDFQDILQALCDVNARFLVIGAYALAVHGSPRATGDIDIWVERSPANAELVYQALQIFGAPLHNLTAQDLQSPDVVFQMGLPPRRIDILTQISGVEFDDAWDSHICVNFGDVNVPVIGSQELIKNKLTTGRPKDLVDAHELRELLEK